MAKKTTGAEWKRFYNDDEFWPGDTYHDDTLVEVNGKIDEDADLGAVQDSDIIVIREGYVFSANGEGIRSLASHFSRWQKQQSTARVVVEVPKDQLDALKAQLASFGAKVIA